LELLHLILVNIVMFDKLFYFRYQKILLKLFNSPIGNLIYPVKRIMKQAGFASNKIVGVYSGGFIFETGRKIKNEKEYKLISFVGAPQISRALNKAWSKVSWIFTLSSLFFKPTLIPLLMPLTTTSYYCGAGDGHNSSGWIAAWADCRGATTGTASYTGTVSYAQTRYESAQGYYIIRGFYPADTSGLGSGVTISSATFYFVMDRDGYNTPASNVYIIPTSQASTSELVDDDFDNVTFSDKGNTAISGLAAVGSYSSIDFSDTSVINKTGWTKIGLSVQPDFSNTAPTTSGDWVEVAPRTSEYADTTSDPYIEVTYTVSAAEDNSVFFGCNF